MKRKFLSVLLALGLLLSTLTGMALADTEAIEAKVFPMLNGLAAGAKPAVGDGRVNIVTPTDGSATTEAVESLAGCTEIPMLSIGSAAELDTVKVELSGRTADDTDWNFLTGYDQAEAVMLYVKAPQSENARIWVSLKSVPAGNTVAAERSRDMNGNQPYSLLAKGTDAWMDSTSTGEGYMPLSSGFEGWVRIPIASFATSDSAAADNFDWLYRVVVQMTNVGGESGAAVVGAPMVITKNSDSVNVKLNGAEKAVNLFTGEEVTEEPETPEGPEDVDVSGITAANQMVFLKGNAVDTEIPLESSPYILLGSEIYRDALSIKAVESMSGISDYSMLQINTKAETDEPVTGLSAYDEKRKVGVELTNLAAPADWADIGEADSMMFYVKMPKTSAATGLWLRLFVAAKDEAGAALPGEVVYEPGQNTQYYTLKKGETDWQVATVQNHAFLDTESGFEGWIRVPFTSFSVEEANKGPEGNYKWIYKWSVFAKEFGGSLGAMTVGAPLIVTNSAYTGDAVTIDDRGIIQNLFTGEEMTREEVFPPLQPGDELLSLPEATTDKEILYPEDEDITTTTAKISWEAFEGAASYRLELFRSAIKDDTTVYVFQKGYDAAQTQQTVDGLEAGMRYIVQVRAYDADGRELAIYDSMAFSAAEDYNDGTGGTGDGGDNTSTDDNSSNSSSPETGVDGSILIMALLALFSGAAVVLVWRKMKRENV